jgi:hypothetical protein
VHLAHETAGAACTRHSLRPLLSWAKLLHTSDAMRRENANTCSIVMIHLVRNCALERTIQYFRDVND